MTTADSCIALPNQAKGPGYYPEHFDEDACDQFRIAEDDEYSGKQVRTVLRNAA